MFVFQSCQLNVRRPLADCTRSIELTRNQNDAKLPLCVDHQGQQELSQWLKKPKRKATKDTPERCGTCTDILKMRATQDKRRDQELDKDFNHFGDRAATGPPEADPIQHHRPSQPPPPTLPETSRSGSMAHRLISWVGHTWQEFSQHGPSVFSWDAWKSCLWDLFTHAGFFTYIHHDAAGFCTYVFIREGCKIWGLLRPCVKSTHNNRRSVYDLMRQAIREHGNLSYMEFADLYTFFLVRGDVL
jgi:hypothetical protein